MEAYHVRLARHIGDFYAALYDSFIHLYPNWNGGLVFSTEKYSLGHESSPGVCHLQFTM